MNFLSSIFGHRYSEIHQIYFDKLAPHVQEAVKTKPIKDQEQLLTTLSKQSEERVELLVNILKKQTHESMLKLFKKETRLLNALLKVETKYLETNVDEPDYITQMIMKDAEQP
jgi:hypothetical protein